MDICNQWTNMNCLLNNCNCKPRAFRVFFYSFYHFWSNLYSFCFRYVIAVDLFLPIYQTRLYDRYISSMLSLHLEGNELIVCLFIVSMMRTYSKINVRNWMNSFFQFLWLNFNQIPIIIQLFTSRVLFEELIRIRFIKILLK